MKAAASLILVALLLAPAQGQKPIPAAVQLHWLDGAPPSISQGVSWGVPWPRGAMKRETTFTLSDSKGNQVPVQTWPLAYWPDGSLKWTGHAISAAGKTAGPLIGASPRASKPHRVKAPA
jgi:YetA-like protein